VADYLLTWLLLCLLSGLAEHESVTGIDHDSACWVINQLGVSPPEPELSWFFLLVLYLPVVVYVPTPPHVYTVNVRAWFKVDSIAHNGQARLALVGRQHYPLTAGQHYAVLGYNLAVEVDSNNFLFGNMRLRLLGSEELLWLVQSDPEVLNGNWLVKSEDERVVGGVGIRFLGQVILCLGIRLEVV